MKQVKQAPTDVFKTSSERLEKVMTSYDLTIRCHDVWQKDAGFTKS